MVFLLLSSRADVVATLQADGVCGEDLPPSQDSHLRGRRGSDPRDRLDERPAEQRRVVPRARAGHTQKHAGTCCL